MQRQRIEKNNRMWDDRCGWHASVVPGADRRLNRNQFLFLFLWNDDAYRGASAQRSTENKSKASSGIVFNRSPPHSAFNPDSNQHEHLHFADKQINHWIPLPIVWIPLFFRQINSHLTLNILAHWCDPNNSQKKKKIDGFDDAPTDFQIIFVFI